MGCVTALGHDLPTTWAALRRGDSGIQPYRTECAHREGVWPAATVKDWQTRDHFARRDALLLDPFTQFAVVAAREAFAGAGLSRPLDFADDTAVVLGTGGGGEQSREQAAIDLLVKNKRGCHPMLVPRSNQQAAVGAISLEWQCRGPAFSVATGCASATHAIVQAAALIRTGLARRAVTGGSEAQLILAVFKAFEAARVLAAEAARPFDKKRDGMVLGEGGGVLILERRADAIARGAPILAELCGGGMSADAHDAVQPHWRGASLAMRRALTDAGLEPTDIGYINAHGTGTLSNDKSEARAIREVFGDWADRMPVSSTKGGHGHVFGGTGAIEAIATVQALIDGVAPPTANHDELDEECPVRVVASPEQPVRGRAAMSNSFAFGGLNATLIFATDARDRD